MTGAPAAVSASRRTSARAGTSVPGSRWPSHTSPPGSCRRQSSLHTTGTGRLTLTLPRRRGGGYHRGMPRVSDLGITVGLLPPGPTGSVLDVPGAGLGHATVWRDEPPPPAGRGTARTGVTVIDPGGDLFRFPVPAGGAVLNGAGECTGMLAAQEWGLAETPGVPDLDHAAGPGLRRRLRAAHRRAARDRRRGRHHPGRGRVRRQFPQRKPPDAGAAGRRAGGPGGGQGIRRDHSGGRGCGGSGNRDELPGLQGRHRHRVPAGARRGDGRGGHDDQLR